MVFPLSGKFVLAFAIGCFVLPSALMAQQQSRIPGASSHAGGPQQQQAIAAGQARFRQTCSNCHGANGEGGQGEGQGPDLITNSDVRRASDAALLAVIRHGVPGTAMPAFPLPSPQIRQLVAFVRSLNATAISLQVPGDIQAGRAIFFGKGECSTCHMIRGYGGFLGPDLTNIGASRRLDQITDAIVKTAAAGSSSSDLYGDPMAGYLPVILKTEDGQTIEGVAKHYSNYSVQVLDKNGKLHLLHGSAIKAVEFREKSWMPDDYAKRLTPKELQDLLAFLSRQSVRPPTERATASAVQPEED